jgi:hypothetical protein
MLVNDSEAIARLESPLNLMNRLRSINSSRNKAMGLFGIGNGKSSEVLPADKRISSFSNPFHRESSSQVASVTITQDIPNNPEVEQIVNNSEDQIKLALAHDKALKVLDRAIDTLESKIDDIKPEKLASVITATSKVVEGIRKERLEMVKNAGNRSVKITFYTPTPKVLSDYNVVEVG